MEPLEKRLQEYLKKRGKNAVIGGASNISADGVKTLISQKVTEYTQDLPFEVKISELTQTVTDDGRVCVGVQLDHQATQRDSLTEHPVYARPGYQSNSVAEYRQKYGSDPDLLYLFNNGWDYSESSSPPIGIWHGEPTEAWASRAGLNYIQSIANAIQQEMPDAEVKYDPAYDGGAD